MGYDKGFSTLRRHIQRVKSSGFALQAVTRNKKPFALNPLQMDELQKWLLDKSSKNEPFSCKDLQKHIKLLWDIDVTSRTCGNYLKRLDFTKKTCQTRTPGFKKLNLDLKDEYWEFILKLRASKCLNVNPATIRS